MFDKITYIQKNGQKFFISEPKESTEEWYDVTYSLVHELMIGVAKQSKIFLENKYDMQDYPFAYRERQMESLVVPVLSKLCDGLVITEYPVNRVTEDGDEYIGHYDFFCVYQGYSFVIEMKHSADLANTDNTRKNSILGRWNTMNKQLREIEKDVKRNEEATKGVIRLGLHFIFNLVEKTVSEELIRDFKKGKCEATLNRISTDLGKKRADMPNKKPDFGACWLLDKKDAEYGDETILGLCLFSKFYKPLKHKGAIE